MSNSRHSERSEESLFAREFVTHSAEETIALGRELATQLRPPVLVCLDGELGAGKTTMAKGIISGLGAAREEDVTSPTFTLVHVFRKGNPVILPVPNEAEGSEAKELPARTTAPSSLNVFHVDLYRVSDRHDLETLGLDDVFAEPAIVLVEWPDRLALRTDWPIVRIKLEHLDGDTRRISIADDAKPQD
jgi:tRNA threonylcarbamoyladenosine biosynthesis protein TsaE